jgi:hypothetical protein
VVFRRAAPSSNPAPKAEDVRAAEALPIAAQGSPAMNWPDAAVTDEPLRYAGRGKQTARSDRVAAADEVQAAEREVLRSALMTLAHRLQPEPLAHRCKRIREAR